MSGPDTTLPNGIWSAPYAIPNFRNTIYAVDGLSPVSSWRSVGASTGGFFTDCFIDELIHAAGLRSEEHTSELQSLMRISYAVFCLKKKKHTKTQYSHQQ